MKRRNEVAAQAVASLDAVQQKLRGFRVSGMAQSLPARLEQARSEGCDYLELLERPPRPCPRRIRPGLHA